MKHGSVQTATEVLSLADDFTFKTQLVSFKEFSQIQIVFDTCGSPPYWQLKLLCCIVNNNKQTQFSCYIKHKSTKKTNSWSLLLFFIKKFIKIKICVKDKKIKVFSFIVCSYSLI